MVSVVDIGIYYIYIVGSCYHLNINSFCKIYWLLRWLLIYYGLWMSIVCAQRRVKINSTCLRRTRMLFGEISDNIFCLQDSSDSVILLSSDPVIRLFSDPVIIYRLSSVNMRLVSIVYHQSSICQFIFICHCHVYIGDWLMVAACWHCTCLVLWWGVVTLLLHSVTPADTLHRALLLAWGCLWRLGVVYHLSFSLSMRGVTAVMLPLCGPVSCLCWVTGSTSALSWISSCGWATI